MAGWREVVIDSPCKLSYKNDYLVIRNDNLTQIHLSEILLLLIVNNMSVVTTMLLSEMAKWKIKVVFCDEKHNPYGELALYYGHHTTSKAIRNQIHWSEKVKREVFTLIIAQKIKNQAHLLSLRGKIREFEMLNKYIEELEIGDVTNREGHAAKVYFNALFGQEFTRDNSNNINSALDYGYSILLSQINREITSYGYLTQLGLKHCNDFNHFNLSCDIIEPFRIIVDAFVEKNVDKVFDKNYKHDLVNLLNEEVFLDKKYYLSNAIGISVRSIIDALDQESSNNVKLFNFNEEL